jgi:hypothetical protein
MADQHPDDEADRRDGVPAQEGETAAATAGRFCHSPERGSTRGWIALRAPLGCCTAPGAFTATDDFCVVPRSTS